MEASGRVILAAALAAACLAALVVFVTRPTQPPLIAAIQANVNRSSSRRSTRAAGRSPYCRPRLPQTDRGCRSFG